jgi:hypothetical protein
VPLEHTGEHSFKELSPSTKTLYFTLCRLAKIYGDKKTGWFFHSLKSLTNESNLTKKTVINAKKILLKLNLIECKRGYRANSNYRASDCYKINGIRMIKN